jgi:hypothetical protein
VGEAAATMRAAVVEREEIAAEVEHHDVAAVDLAELARARRDIIDGGNDVGGHVGSDSPPSCPRLSRASTS